MKAVSVYYDHDQREFSRLASSIVYGSIKDVKDRGQSGYHILTRYRVPRNKQATPLSIFISSVVWLGCKHATPWFEIAGLDQEECLSIIAWPLYARAILDDLDCEITEEQEQVLHKGINYLPKVTRKTFLHVNGDKDSVISYLCPSRG